MQSLYSVTIAFANAGTAPSDGNIDPTTVSQYTAANAAGPATLAASLAKTRANYRYKMLCQQLGLDSTIYVYELVAPGADGNTAPTSITFNAVVEHGDDSLYVYDETNNNAILTGIPALVRRVARALIEQRESVEVMYYDPTTAAAPGNTTQANRVGMRVDSIDVGPVAANLTAAAALVTVTKLA